MFKICIDNEGNREYLNFTNEDKQRVKKAEIILEEKRRNKFTSIPTEPAPPKEALGNRAALYGYDSFDKFFSPRQLLFQSTVAEKIDEIYSEIKREANDEDLASLIMLLLAFTLDRVADRNSFFSVIDNEGKSIHHTFATAAFRMTWDFAESNPFTPGSGSWKSSLSTTFKAIRNCTIFTQTELLNMISSATSIPIEP